MLKWIVKSVLVLSLSFIPCVLTQVDAGNVVTKETHCGVKVKKKCGKPLRGSPVITREKPKHNGFSRLFRRGYWVRS